MVVIDDKDRGLPCPRCKNITTELVSLTDDGNGKRMCKKCKRKIRKTFPKKDFSRWENGLEK